MTMLIMIMIMIVVIDDYHVVIKWTVMIVIIVNK